MTDFDWNPRQRTIVFGDFEWDPTKEARNIRERELDFRTASGIWNGANALALIGHGKPTPMDAKEALAIAKDASPEAKSVPDPFEPRGFKPGDRVTVSADDYGRDPIAGEIVFTNAHEIAIRRHDAQVGEIVVHFPRAGFVVAKA